MRLLFHIRNQMLSFFFSLRFQNANWFAINKQNIVRRTHIGLIFSHRHTRTFIEIDFAFILNAPTGLTEHQVNLITGELFGGLVKSGHWVVAIIVPKSPPPRPNFQAPFTLPDTNFLLLHLFWQLQKRLELTLFSLAIDRVAITLLFNPNCNLMANKCIVFCRNTVQ